MLDQIRIVLVNTSHPGNIGSAARAMKTMGLKQLYLVDPKEFPARKAHEMASSATDVVDGANVFATLEEAVSDCHLVVGASARTRSIPWPMFNPNEIGQKVKAEAADSKIAIVFGRENSGLTNEELRQCHLHVNIPANPEYSSLNLAQAVQVICYELRMASLTERASQDWDCRLATSEEMDHLFQHLEEAMVDINFLKKTSSRQLMTRMRRLFLRARPDEMEVSILRGILTAVQQSIGQS